MLLLNKPPGPTSHDIVDIVRKQTGEGRVGHAGTLDPFAEGLLIVLVGREETRRQAEFLKLDKEYIATLHLGAESDTGDRTGKLQETRTQTNSKFQIPNDATVRMVLKKFEGEQMQMPPAYSAIKVRGKKAYELARKGEDVALKPRAITVYDIALVKYEWPSLILRAKVSSGTYIRALARDIGRELGVGAYAEKLVRTKIGQYDLQDAEIVDVKSKIH